MKKFAFKILLLSFPLIVLVGLFFILDPFRLFHTYNNYSDNMFVEPNRDFVSGKMFLKNVEKYHYNSFIFGSSRTMAYKTDSWRKHLPDNASPFVFDASGESIFGIYTKIKFLDQMDAKLDNCLVILCTDCTFRQYDDHKGHIGIKYPKVAGTSWINFYVTFIKDYLDFNFLVNYYQYLFTRTFTPSMKGYLETRKMKYDGVTNDVWILDQEKEIQETPVAYYQKRKSVFYSRSTTISFAKQQIPDIPFNMLREISDIFKKHHTNYRIVISPLYAQVRFNPKDLELLQNLFGKEFVCSFNYIWECLCGVILCS